MAKPTADDILSESQVDFGSLGFPDTGTLEPIFEAALSFLFAYTGRAWDDAGEFEPEPLEPLALMATRQLTEMLAYRAQEDVPETIADFDVLQSFSAGSYSETRRDPRNAIGIGIAALMPLQSVLWPLMTDEARDNWIMLTGGPTPPGMAVTEVDWGNRGASGSDTGFGGHGSLPVDPWPPMR